MITNIDNLIPALREALSVDESYDTTVLPNIISRCLLKLLRDYHFPKTITREFYTDLQVGRQEYALPTGFKKEHMIVFYDPEETRYARPLLKREGFTLPEESGESCYYWLEGSSLFTDVTLIEENQGIELRMWYESMDVALNQDWLINNYSDVIFALCMYSAASQLRKSELVTTWRAIWSEERTSLAVFLNELQFDNSELVRGESRNYNHSERLERYPRDRNY